MTINKHLGAQLKRIRQEEVERQRKERDFKIRPEFEKLVDGLEEKVLEHAKEGKYVLYTIKDSGDYHDFYHGGLYEMLRTWCKERGLTFLDVSYPAVDKRGSRIEITIYWNK